MQAFFANNNRIQSVSNFVYIYGWQDLANIMCKLISTERNILDSIVYSRVRNVFLKNIYLLEEKNLYIYKCIIFTIKYKRFKIYVTKIFYMTIKY